MKRLAIVACLLLSACSSEEGSLFTNPLPAAPPVGEPADLFGNTASQLRHKFGEPALTRNENGSVLWRYDNKQCRAFFFLYPRDRDGSLAVRHVETVPKGADIAADLNCLASLRGRPVS